MRYRIITSVLVLLSFITIGMWAPVAAQTTSNPTANTSSSAASQATERNTRIEALKAQLKKPLTNTEIVGLQTKCVAAQSILLRATAQATEAAAKRKKVYDKVQDDVATLIAKLESQNVPTAELRNAKTALSGKIDTYSTDLAVYQQALADTSAMGCANDPTGFKVSLEAARTAREKVRLDAEDIHTYVTQTLKPILDKIRDNLKSSSTQGGQ